MADIIVDGKVKVWSVPTISNIAAPTTAELNAGFALEALLTPDGMVNFAPETADVDNSSLASDFDTVLPGRAAYAGTALRFKKQSGVDTLYATLILNYPTNIVVRRNGSTASTAWASSNQVEVYPVTCGQVKNLDPEKNSVQKYEVPTKVSSSPNLRATVA